MSKISKWVVGGMALLVLLVLLDAEFGGVSHIQPKGYLTLRTIDLRAVTICLHLYADEHGGKYPLELATLLKEGYVDPEGEKILKVQHDDGSKAEEWIYFPGATASSPQGTILAASPPLHRPNRSVLRILGMNDGRVQTIKDSDFEEILKKNGQNAPSPNN